MWTEFFDLSTAGVQKTPHKQIFIDLPMSQAIVFFKENFGISPLAQSCSCGSCDDDFDISEHKTLPEKRELKALILKTNQ